MRAVRPGIRLAAWVATVAAWFSPAARAERAPLEVGFAERDITPDVNDPRGVWLAGFAPGRRATDVHDPLVARAVVLSDGAKKFAFVSVDLLGLMRPEVLRVRSLLPGFDYVMVNSTHNHNGPDTIGIWGPTPFRSGVDRNYMERVAREAAAAVRAADENRTAVEVDFGAAVDADLLSDARLPVVRDGELRALRFRRADGRGLAGLLVNWNCHPEALGSRNTLVTADFCAATVAALRRRHHGPVAYFTGTVGGLMAPPDGRFRDPQGQPYREGDFAWSDRYGVLVAELAEKALADAKPIELRPLAAWSATVHVPLENPLYRLGQLLGTIDRTGREWRGDPDAAGAPYRPEASRGLPAIETEVACLRLGELEIACIPGEIYPELVYGQFQEPAEPHADFPAAPLEPPVFAQFRGAKRLLFGLANDELGYILPKRQWDRRPPYAYGRARSQYGEVNSVGPEVAPLVLEAFRRQAARANAQPKTP